MDGLPSDGRPAFLKPNNSYDLLYPVKWKEGEQEKLLEGLQLRRMTGHEKIISEGSGTLTERIIAILASMTGQMEIVLRKIDWVDLDRLDECIGFFTEHGPATGPIS